MIELFSELPLTMNLPQTSLPPHFGKSCFKLSLAVWLLGASFVHADSVVVFNEVMYHPAANEARLEWVELHNQMAVDVDMSGWSITGGIGFQFAEGTIIPGGGYLVVALSPSDLTAAAGATNVMGPFTGRLSNAGDTLQLLNNNQRLMDEMSYGVEGDWPVGPDGAGVALAKRDEGQASGPARNWTVSAEAGGTPGRRNFSTGPAEVVSSTPVSMSTAWKYNASGSEPGAGWTQLAFDDRAWASGQGLFQAGTASPPFGDLQAVPTVFSSGVGANGAVLSPGAADPHYKLTKSAHSTPPPPDIAATVIQNHPAWLANDALSSWIGPVNPGSESVAAGAYNYRTTFTLDGFDLASAVLKMNLGADNRVTNVYLNNVALGINYAGFGTLSGDYTITKNFAAGANTLDFYSVNDDSSANPGGFRAKLTATARQQFPVRVSLPNGRTSYYFRTSFAIKGNPRYAGLTLNSVMADGAIFYINGSEVMRYNMPAGPVGAGTLAVTNVVKPAYLGPFALPAAGLVSGTNVLAVEIHQGPGADGVLFGADLSLTITNLPAPPPVSLAFNEFSSATNADFWIELINYSSGDLDLGGCVLARQGGTTNREYVFPSGTLAAGALMAVPASTLGFGADPGDRLFLYSPGKASVLDAVIAKREPRGRWPDATGRWWYPTELTPDASNHFEFRKEVVINEIMYNAPAIPPVAGSYGTNILLSATNVWKYHNLGQDLGSAWRSPTFNDDAWEDGQAVFYYSSATLPAQKNTLLPLTNSAGTRIITWYFRTPFVYTGETNGAQLSLRPIVDDGAVYYLNGKEIYRQNMPAGEIRYSTLATPGVGTPAFSGPFTVTASNLLSGINLLAVEVHQFTTNPIAADMAFALEVSMVGQLSPPVPGHASPESWLELMNRGSNAVDLTGWKLDHDIGYDFPPGTTIPAGGYLVVAKDAGYVRTNYPGIDVLGPFSGSLRRRGSHILLLDSAGNPADEVRYYDAKPWPEYADGGGSSLELRDPWADNSKPEAWADSIESSRAGWNTYVYRGVAANVHGPTRWNEFVMGLLDAGECLIDDLSVLESPAGSPVQLLQNGSFETGLTAWRALGDHSRSRVEVDPDNAANHVLHLVATGSTDHLHNHLETTYAGGRVVTDGKQYQISFRAKWLAGNNRLNTRLYFSRVAKTTELLAPTLHGTPGMRNSTYAANVGPTFADFGHSPVVPPANTPITVSVNAGDSCGISAVALYWSANGGAWNTTSMRANASVVEPGYANYTAVIPGQAAGTLVQFYARAVDGLGATSTYPAGGTNSRALFKVEDGKPLMTQLHRIRMLMLPAEAEYLHASTNVMSMAPMPLTVVYDEKEVFYDVSLHLQSSERGRDNSTRVGFTVQFPADQLFRGVQKNFTIDRSGGYSGQGGRHDEILLWQAVNHAGGGLLGLDCDLVQVFAPRAQEDSTGLLRMAAFNADYFDNQFKNGGDGNRYKLELIYYPTSTSTGGAEAPKLPQPDDVIDSEFQDWGDDKENYRWIFRQDNNPDQDDYSRLIAMNKALSLSGAAQEAQTEAVMDTDEYLRTLAFVALIGAGDIFTYGLNHNWKLYIRPEDNKVLGLLWDMDYNFVQSISYGFPGGGSSSTYRFTMLPNNYRRYYNHLLDLTTTSVNSAYLNRWAAHYAGLLGQNWSGAVNYLQQRATYVRSLMPLSTAFAITSNSGKNFGTTNSTAALAGTAPLTVKEIEVNGVSYPLTWTSLTTWTLTVSLRGRTNLFITQGVDNYGNRLASATDSITITNLGATALAPVVINEWMADNAGPGGFLSASGAFKDWFELYNPNNAAVDLSGFHLTDTLSQPAKWEIPANTVMAPHGFLLVWADNQTDLNGSDITGDLHANFQLNNGGEAIGLYAPDITPQHTIVFTNQFQNVSQGLFPDGNTNAFYLMTNWSPRAANRLGGLAATHLNNVAFLTDGGISFSFATQTNRAYRIDYKDDLGGWWNPLVTNRADLGTIIISDQARGIRQRFYRVVLLQ